MVFAVVVVAAHAETREFIGLVHEYVAASSAPATTVQAVHVSASSAQAALSVLKKPVLQFTDANLVLVAVVQVYVGLVPALAMSVHDLHVLPVV